MADTFLLCNGKSFKDGEVPADAHIIGRLVVGRRKGMEVFFRALTCLPTGNVAAVSVIFDGVAVCSECGAKREWFSTDHAYAQMMKHYGKIKVIDGG